MKPPKFKIGDLVTCKESHEILQPMEIIGRNQWYSEEDIIVYQVQGKHIKKGNTLVINLSEGILEKV